MGTVRDAVGVVGVAGAGWPGDAAGTVVGAAGTMNVLPHDLQRVV
jgi:hypothetical protein